MKITISKILLFLLILTSHFTAKGNNMNSTDNLIPLKVLFDNPEKIMVRISKDGKYLSYVAPKNNVLNIWVVKIDNLKDAKVITKEKVRGIRIYSWLSDNKHILYLQDEKGDENWRMEIVNVETGKITQLTNTKGVVANLVKSSLEKPNEILISTNERDSKYFDIYKINIKNGERTLIYQNDMNFIGYIADEKLNLRFAYRTTPSGIGEIYQFSGQKFDSIKLFKTIEKEDLHTSSTLHLNNDGSHLYIINSEGKDIASLDKINTESKDITKVFHSQQAEINNIFVGQ